MATNLQQFQYEPLAEPPVIPPNPNSLGFHPSYPAQIPTRARGLDVSQQPTGCVTFRKAITGEENGIEAGGTPWRIRDWALRAANRSLVQADPSPFVFVPIATQTLGAASFHPDTTRATASLARHLSDCLTFKEAITGNEFGVVKERGPHWDGHDRYQRNPVRLLAQLEPASPFVFNGPAATFTPGAASFHVDTTRRLTFPSSHQRATFAPDATITPTPQIAPSFSGGLVVFRYQFQYEPYTFAPFHQISTNVTGSFAGTTDDVRIGRSALSRFAALLQEPQSDPVVATIPLPGTATLVPIAMLGASERIPTMPATPISISGEAFPSVPFGWVPTFDARTPRLWPQTRIEGLTFTNAGLIAPPNAWGPTYPDTTRRLQLAVAQLPSLFKGEALEQLAATLLWYPHAPDRVPYAKPQTRIEGLILPLSSIAIVTPTSAWQPSYPDGTRRATLPVSLMPSVTRAESVEQFAARLGWASIGPDQARGRLVLRALLPAVDAPHGLSTDIIPTPAGFLPTYPDWLVRRALAAAQHLAQTGGPSHELLPVPPLAWLPQVPEAARRARWPEGLRSEFRGEAVEQFAPTLLWLPLTPETTRRARLFPAAFPSWNGVQIVIVYLPTIHCSWTVSLQPDRSVRALPVRTMERLP